MKTKIVFALIAFLMFGNVNLNAQENGNLQKSESTTSLEGDLNHDGKVDAADITYLVNIILKKTNEPVEGDFWYWGDDIDNAGAPGDGPIYDMLDESFGWHRLDVSKNSFAIPYWEVPSGEEKNIVYAVPVASGFTDIQNYTNVSQLYAFTIETRTINGIEYNVYTSIMQYKRANGLYFVKK